MTAKENVGLRRGNGGNRGGGRPKDLFRRRAAEAMQEWLVRASLTLVELQKTAKDFDEKMRVVEAAGRLAERFGKYVSAEHMEEARRPSTPVVIDFGSMSVQERREFLKELS